MIFKSKKKSKNKDKRVQLSGDIGRKELDRIKKASKKLDPPPTEMNLTQLKAVANFGADILLRGGK